MTEMVLDDDEQALISRVPQDGTAIGNISLRRSLRWSEARYDSVWEALVAKGVIGVGKGQGGSVWLVEPYIRDLLLSVPADGSFTTRGAILKQTQWTEERLFLLQILQ